MTHARIEERSLAMHRVVAAHLRNDPERTLRVALGNLDRWITTASASSRPYLLEWRRLILESTPLELAAVIEKDSERMRELRQSSPFAGVLSPEERWRIYDTFATGTPDSSLGHDRGRLAKAPGSALPTATMRTALVKKPRCSPPAGENG